LIRLRRRRARGLWSPTVAATGWGESTYAELSWGKSRGASLRWAIAGAVLGTLIAFVLFAPAAWLAGRVASITQQRVQLADARGTIWSGSAIAVLTGGEGSRDASTLPGRIEWTLRPHGLGLEISLQHACCLNGTLAIQVQPGLGRTVYSLVTPSDWVGQWPTALLGGLGTPWNTMQLGGTMRLVSKGLRIETVQGRIVVDGRADFEVVDMSSRLSTLESLGSYRLSVSGDAANPGISELTLTTQDGALKLSGNGTWGPGGVRFRGEARASDKEQAALSNLLNIIGRRDGARSVISIG
jgi:general secretion pathway protein N